MAIRDFTDSFGNSWQVWETHPTTSVVRDDFATGWLTFERGHERKRLAPIPPDWATLDEEGLRRLLRGAVALPRRSGTAGG